MDIDAVVDRFADHFARTDDLMAKIEYRVMAPVIIAAAFVVAAVVFVFVDLEKSFWATIISVLLCLFSVINAHFLLPLLEQSMRQMQDDTQTLQRFIDRMRHD